jgi:hypothetical protein
LADKLRLRLREGQIEKQIAGKVRRQQLASDDRSAALLGRVGTAFEYVTRLNGDGEVKKAEGGSFQLKEGATHNAKIGPR